MLHYNKRKQFYFDKQDDSSHLFGPCDYRYRCGVLHRIYLLDTTQVPPVDDDDVVTVGVILTHDPHLRLEDVGGWAEAAVGPALVCTEGGGSGFAPELLRGGALEGRGGGASDMASAFKRVRHHRTFEKIAREVIEEIAVVRNALAGTSSSLLDEQVKLQMQSGH